MNTSDIIFLICNSLNDIDKFAFLSTTTLHDKLKNKMWFNDRVYFYRIHGHRYYDRFTNLIICPMTKNCIDRIGDEIVALRKIRLPFCIRRLECNYDIEFDNIPDGLTHFCNYVSDISELPTSVTHLKLIQLNKLVSSQLLTDHPKHLDNLKFVEIDNFFLTNNINKENYLGFPKTVTHIICRSYMFDHDHIDLIKYSTVQSNLEHLYFNMIPLTKYQPPSIGYLMGLDLSDLYVGLKKLSVYMFNLTSDSLSFLINLDVLEIGILYGNIVNDILPPNITYFKIGRYDDNASSIKQLPINIRRLSLGEVNNIDNVSLPNLTRLNIKFNYDSNTFDAMVLNNIISPQLFYLKINNNIIPPNIPSTVRHLTIYNFNKTIRKNIPSFITHLTFGNEFNKSVRCNIPPSVTHLTLGKNFYQKKLGNVLPKTVIHLTLSPKCYTLNQDNLRNRNLSIAIQHVYEKNPFKEF